MIFAKRVTPFLSILFAVLLAAVAAFGQGDQLKPGDLNLEATLHVLVDSNRTDTGKPLPTSLAGVARQLRSEFGAQNLRVLNTYLGRLGNAGSIEYKGVSNSYVQDPIPGSPSFLEWRVIDLRSVKNSSGASVYQVQSVSFGARVPVQAGVRDEAGKTVSPINYESIGLSLQRFSVSDATPTILGNLNQPNTGGSLFLVLTVKNVEK